MGRVTHGDPLHRSRRWFVLAAALTVLGAFCVVLGLQVHRHPLAAPAAAHEHVNSVAPTMPIGPPALARSIPVTLSVPAIGLTTALVSLGLNPDGTVQVPTDIQEAGWYRLGPTPGQVGSAVLLGHVDSYQGPAVFFELRSLVAGDGIQVALADGDVARFVVTSVAMYSKAAFPDQQVYGSHGVAELQLVTCGGTFDAQTGSYLSNVVVYSTFVGATPDPSSS
jgi:hypothetical protein